MDEVLITNLADAPTFAHPRGVKVIDLERGREPWPDTGVNVQILEPGVPNCRYHREPVQEDFLVLAGECIAIVNDEEHRLGQWDFFHCPAGIDHVFVGAGNGPCAVLMIGSRRIDAAHYPVSQVAARYGASVKEPTSDPKVAYADWRASASAQETASPWPIVPQ